MAKKEKKSEAAKAVTPEEKLAKKKARLEAIKNRPADQRPNSKQIDIIDLGDGNVIKNFGYVIKQKNIYKGILVTSVALKNGEVTSTSTSFVPGELTIKVKKNHGAITAVKYKANKKGQEVAVEDETEEETED